jgi:hypothetical protein
MTHSKFTAAVLLVLSLASIGHAGTIYPVNNGFESPDLGSGGTAYGYWSGAGYTPVLPSTPPGWTFAGNTGISANGSNFGTTGATNGNSDGGTSKSGQAAIIQNGYDSPNTISQALSGFLSGPASVTFSLENRGSNDGSVDVSLDGHDLGTYAPLSGSSFNSITTPTTLLGAGTHTLTFTGVNAALGGDNTVFIDNVHVTSTPEPASFVLCGLGAIGLFIAARRRRG